PHRSVAESRFRDEGFFYELAVLLERLNPVVLAVADIDRTIFRDRDTAHRAKLFRRRRIRIVGAEAGVIRLLAVSAPVTFVGSGVGVEDDDAAIDKSVGDIDLIGRRIDSGAGVTVQPCLAVTALNLARAPDLQQ